MATRMHLYLCSTSIKEGQGSHRREMYIFGPVEGREKITKSKYAAGGVEMYLPAHQNARPDRSEIKMKTS
jgi:hypothetical protein